MPKTATALREKPILFSSEMVRAILDGRKTITRRVVKPQPEFGGAGGKGGAEWNDPRWWGYEAADGTWVSLAKNDWCDSCIRAPYEVGMRLWVRETWSPDHAAFYPNFPIVYRADFGPEYDRNDRGEVYSSEQKAWYPFQWRPSIFMPRHLSRITLEIVSVRVERLQEITNEDAELEGFTGHYSPAYVSMGEIVGPDGQEPIEEFRELWGNLNGKTFPWESNPWVWRVEFKRIEPKGGS